MEFELLIAALVAPAVGSFLGVVSDRVPEGQPVVLARSRCDGCGRILGIRDLVPLVSWAARFGWCRCGRMRLGARYPIIELTAVVVVVWAAMVVSGWLFWVSIALGWTLLALAVIDFRHQLLPDALTLPLIPAGLAVVHVVEPSRLLDHVLAAVAGYAGFAAIALVYHRARGREGLGLGDAKLLAAAGAWLGWAALPSVVVLGAGLALAVALAQTAAGAKLAPTTQLPFGPYLAAGFWLVWLHGRLVFG